MLQCRLVTFDIVNTLLKVTGSPGHQYAEVASQYGLHVDHNDITRVYRPMYVQMKHEYPHYGVHNNLSTKQWWNIFVRRVFKKVAPVSNDELLYSITNTLWDRFSEGSNWEVLPHRKTVLEQLKDKGLCLGVVSNFDERLEHTLKKQNLHQYFDFYVTVVSAGAEKPDPKTFLTGLEFAAVKPEHALHIGDDIRDDYFGAKRVGMHAFLLDPEFKFKNDFEKYGIKKNDLLTDIRQLPDRVSTL